MSIVSAVIDPVLQLHGVAAYALVGGLAFAEAAIFVGFVLPGETAVILGGVLAHQHQVVLPVMTAVVVLAAIGGDSVGYEVGRHFGQRLLALRILDRRRAALDRGRARLREKGGPTVLLSRFTAFLRAVMPALAGLSRLRYRTFLAWNAAGGLLWGVGFTLLGYLAGAGYQEIETYAGDLSWVVLAVVVIVLVVRHRRSERHPAPGSAPAPSAASAPAGEGA